jgi:hypothetical protein
MACEKESAMDSTDRLICAGFHRFKRRVVMAGPDIIQSLENIKLQVQEELRAVREYRALLNIRNAIADLTGIEEMTGPLDQVASQLQVRLKEIREYQSLEAVEKSIADVSGVLELLQAAARKRGTSPKDTMAGVKFAPGLVGRPAKIPGQPTAVSPDTQPAVGFDAVEPEASETAAPPEPAQTTAPAPASRGPVDDIEADIANVLRVGERLRLKN